MRFQITYFIFSCSTLNLPVFRDFMRQLRLYCKILNALLFTRACDLYALWRSCIKGLNALLIEIRPFARQLRQFARQALFVPQYT